MHVYILKEGKDIGIIATGSVVGNSLEVANRLEEEGASCRVINMASIKPIDKDLIVETAKKVKLIITVEDHNIIGGLGSAVAEILSENYPKKLFRIGMRDQFGESGTPGDLYKKYKLDVEGIYEQIKSITIH